jgi:hypothetical protein
MPEVKIELAINGVVTKSKDELSALRTAVEKITGPLIKNNEGYGNEICQLNVDTLKTIPTRVKDNKFEV